MSGPDGDQPDRPRKSGGRGTRGKDAGGPRAGGPGGKGARGKGDPLPTPPRTDAVVERARRLEPFGLASIADRIDPYLAWAAATGAIDAKRWLPLLLQLTVPARDFAARARDAWPDCVRVPAWVERAPRGLDGTHFVSAWVRPAFFRELSRADAELGALIDRFEFGLPDGVQPADDPPGKDDPPGNDDPSGRCERASTASSASTEVVEPRAGGTSEARRGSPAPRVVVGVVDDGIAFANRRVRTADGHARVRWFWDQRDAEDEPVFAGGAGVPHGVEWSADSPGAGVPGLDDLFARHRHAGVVDEDAVYRATGQAQVADRARHGTHVMDLAAGADPDVEPDAPAIVAVQLPAAVTDDPSGRLLAPQLYDALRYVVDRADRIAEASGATSPLPVAVTVSYGLYGGPHDGSSLLESAIDDLVRTRETVVGAPLAVVVAAGNSALARCHAQLTLQPGDTRTLRWRVPPDSGTDAFVELWMGHVGTPSATSVRVRLLPPGGVPRALEVGLVDYDLLDDPAPIDATATASQRTLATASFVRESSPSWVDARSYYADRDLVLLTVSPTATLDSRRSVAPAGVWTIEIVNDGADSVDVHAWIRRNDTPFGSRARGRQSRFEDAGYAVRDDVGRLIEDDDAAAATPIRRASTLNGIATGGETLVIGAQHSQRGRPSPYTARGPALAQPVSASAARTGPDAGAPGDTSSARRGILAAGTRTGAVVALDGTSVAAPAATRAIAAVLALGDPTIVTARQALAAASAPQAAQWTGDVDRIGPCRIAAPRDGMRLPR